MYKEIAGIMECVACDGHNLVLEPCGSHHVPSEQEGSIICRDCGRVIPIRRGMVENFPDKDDQSDIWDGLYRESRGANLQGQINTLDRGFSMPDRLSAYYPLVRAVSEMPVPPVSSVELGCGSGAYSLVLKKLGLVEKVTLVDYSIESLRTARDLFDHFGESCTLVHSSIESHPFRNGAFDLSFSGGVIEHYPTTAERLACMEAHLAVAGRAFIQAPVNSWCYWIQRAIVTVMKVGWPFGYEKPLTTGEMRRLAGLAGARIERLDYHFFLSFLVFRIPRSATVRRFLEPVWFTRPMRTELAVLLTRSC